MHDVPACQVQHHFVIPSTIESLNWKGIGLYALPPYLNHRGVVFVHSYKQLSQGSPALELFPQI